jgi:hypothetical protein
MILTMAHVSLTKTYVCNLFGWQDRLIPGSQLPRFRAKWFRLQGRARKRGYSTNNTSKRAAELTAKSTGFEMTESRPKGQVHDYFCPVFFYQKLNMGPIEILHLDWTSSVIRRLRRKSLQECVFLMLYVFLK